MKTKIKLHPNSSQEKIQKISKTEIEVWIKTKPLAGKANLQLIKLLKKHFKKEAKIISGFNSRFKIIELT